MLFGYTGSEDTELSDSLSRSLKHRGPVELVGSVAGQRTERHDGVAIAWSGTIRSKPDSITAAYRQYGTAFIDSLDGEFVIAVRDGEKLHVARDAAGARTAYYGRLGDRWVIAAEPKAFWQHPEFSRQLRPGAVAQYFTYSFIPGRQTMFTDLWEICPGEIVTLEAGKEPDRKTYFDITVNEPSSITIEDAPKRFRELMESEVEKRLDPSEQPTVFLSGGLDSSIVTAEVARQSRKPVRTFAIHFGRKYPNELEYARMVAERFNTDHIEVEVSPKQAVSRMEQMVWHLDEPIGDPITAPNFELAAFAARHGVTKVFNGEGGDPLFGGPKNLTMLLSHWYGGVDHSPGFRERRYLESYRRAFEELDLLLSDAQRNLIDEERDLHSPLKPFFESSGPFLHKLLAINTRLKGAHLILPKVERMLAASDLEPLSPMFTKDMIRFAFSAPPNAKLRAGCEKWLMKQAYEDVLPREIIDRPKSGMRVPVHFWFKGPLKRYARRILNQRSLAKSGLFNPDRVKQWLRYDIERPGGRYGLRIWMLLTFEIWRRQVMESKQR